MDAEVARLREETPIIFVDIHAETTSEKVAMGRFLDGRVSAVVGTHTHVQTADEQVFPGGTAFLCDAGFCGPSESCLGRDVNAAIIHRFHDEPAGAIPHRPGRGPAAWSHRGGRPGDRQSAESIRRLVERYGPSIPAEAGPGGGPARHAPAGTPDAAVSVPTVQERLTTRFRKTTTWIAHAFICSVWTKRRCKPPMPQSG